MRKLLLVVILIGVLLGGIAFGAVLYEIVSPSIPVTVENYELTLDVNATTCLVDEVLWFNGTFTKNGTPQSGQNIMLVCDNVPTGLSDTTDADGYYEMFYTVTQIGSFTFYTNTTVTMP